MKENSRLNKNPWEVSDADLIDRARELCELAISVGVWPISLNCYQSEEHQCAICIAQQLIGEELESGTLEITCEYCPKGAA